MVLGAKARHPGAAHSICSVKLWNTSCPDASLTATITSAVFSSWPCGTSQRTSPARDTFSPSGPLDSSYLTPPYFDFTFRS